jgi:hypothetical protein
MNNQTTTILALSPELNTTDHRAIMGDLSTQKQVTSPNPVLSISWLFMHTHTKIHLIPLPLTAINTIPNHPSEARETNRCTTNPRHQHSHWIIQHMISNPITTWYQLIRIKSIHNSNLDSREMQIKRNLGQGLLEPQTTGNRSCIPVVHPAKTTAVYNLHMDRNASSVNVKTLHSSGSVQVKEIFQLKLGVPLLVMSM